MNTAIGSRSEGGLGGLLPNFAQSAALGLRRHTNTNGQEIDFILKD